LTGCGLGKSEPVVITEIVTPNLIEYDEVFTQAAAAEAEQLGPNSALVIMVQDYIRLRDQIRALKN
jgi:hypothetical protein